MIQWKDDVRLRELILSWRTHISGCRLKGGPLHRRTCFSKGKDDEDDYGDYGGYHRRYARSPSSYGGDYGYGGGCYTVPRVRWTPYGYRRVLVERCD